MSNQHNCKTTTYRKFKGTPKLPLWLQLLFAVLQVLVLLSLWGRKQVSGCTEKEIPQVNMLSGDVLWGKKKNYL